MPRKTKQHREFRFPIDAYSPETLPMARLAEYIRDLATMLGEEKNVHLIKVEKGSTVPVMLIEWEAEPKVRERLRAVKFKDAPAEAMRAAHDIDHRLAEDNAKAVLLDPAGKKLFRFPGRELLNKPVFGPINQEGVLQGIPIKVGGENDPVPVHLEDGNEKHIVMARRGLAKELAQYLFTAFLRVKGTGRWMRHSDGEWEMLNFNAASYELIKDVDIHTDVEELRRISAEWKKLDDPLAALEDIKSGRRPQ